MIIQKFSDVTDVYFYNCELQMKEKHSKVKKVTFSDFYCLINTKFWITNEKNLIKKKSLLVMYISSFLHCELKIRVKTFKNQKKIKKVKSHF